MGATHIKAFSGIEGVSVSAVSANNPRALDGDLTQVGGNLGHAGASYDFSSVRKYTNWRDLVADPDMDAVDICLPTDLHLPASLAALSAGKHVLCEKPMALTAEQCDQMISAAQQTERVLMIGQVLRFWPEYRYLEEFVKSGEHGKIKTVTFVRRCGVPDWSKWLMDEQRSGGALLDLLVHDIDQALFLFGDPAKVTAKTLGRDDTVSASLIYPGGPEVRIQGGWFPAGTEFAMSFQVRAERAELLLDGGGLRLNDAQGNSTAIKTEGEGYDAEVSYFVECCRENKQPERCLPQDSAKAVKLALLLKESRSRGGDPIACAL
jgi:predicted dehydrogenase